MTDISTKLLEIMVEYKCDAIVALFILFNSEKV